MSQAVLQQPRLALDAEPAGPLSAGVRLQSIDMLRGLVIMLMALDHARDYFHVSALIFEPTDLAQTHPLLFLTRIVTHLCAPSFVLLAGVSAFIKGARDGDRAGLAWFLLGRGAWLVLLELTVVNFGWDFALGAPFLQVIWAIGASMMLLSALVLLPPRAVLAIGVLIIAGHDLLDGVHAARFGTAAPLWNAVHESGTFDIAGHTAFLAYPVLPWLGVMAFGYGVGRVFLKPEAQRRRTLLVLGLSMLAAFVIVRATNLYGDPVPWSVQKNAVWTLMSFLNVSKYPPSLLYVLMTLGPAFLLLWLFERVRGPLAEGLLTFGRVPLFFYVLHIYLLHGAAMLVSVVQGYPVSASIQTITRPGPLKGFGFTLPVVYLVWIAALVILYPLCRWFGALKRRRRDWWLSYL